MPKRSEMAKRYVSVGAIKVSNAQGGNRCVGGEQTRPRFVIYVDRLRCLIRTQRSTWTLAIMKVDSVGRNNPVPPRPSTLWTDGRTHFHQYWLGMDHLLI